VAVVWDGVDPAVCRQTVHGQAGAGNMLADAIMSPYAVMSAAIMSASRSLTTNNTDVSAGIL
jgi:hypothetical protein